MEEENKNKKKRTGMIIAAAVIAALLIAIAVLSRGGKKEEPLPDNLITKEKAQSLVLEELSKEASSEEDVDSLAYLWPEVLRPGASIKTWDEDSEETITDKYYWMAWIDLEPGNPFFSHETKFMFINAETGEYAISDQEFWPVINGESFEGSLSTELSLRPGEEESASPSAGYTEKYLSIIHDMVFREASAQSGSLLRITPKEENAPTGEYYAVIVSGYGRNSWVFLDGAQAMYEALKGIGYDDAHISFLAQGPAKLDPAWDRQGSPRLVRSDAVDMATSPDNLRKVFKDLSEKMTKNDSLFVFVLAHGSKGSVAMGRPLSNNSHATLEQALYGNSGNLSSRNFSEALLDDMSACEVMVMFDSCYSGSHRPKLEEKYDPEKVKRLSVAHSTNDKTRSYGADYRDPAWLKKKAKADLDYGGTKKTPTADLNPEDHGGEFSSGMITNLNKTIYSVIYESGLALDAAQVNGMTEPSLWGLGEEGPCVAVEPPDLAPPEEPMSDPEPEDSGSDEPEEPASPPVVEAPKKKISVVSISGSYVPVEQLKKYSAAECPCCGEDHWHAKNGTVRSIAGKVITDPYSDCGLGKLSEHPIIQIEVEE